MTILQSSIQIHPAVLSVLSAIIVGLIGFFAGGYLNNNNKVQAELSKTVSRLANSITKLDTTIEAMKDANEKFTESCKERHTAIDKRLDKLDQ